MQHPELSTSRPEAESQPLRRLDVVFRSADPPALDLELLASAFGESMLVLEVAGRTGIRLEPTPAKLEALERFLSEIRGQACSAPQLAATWQPTDREESLILSCGAVLGETIIAEYGGVWECDPKAPTDPRLFRVICEDRVAAWPMTLVYLRLKSATSNALADFLARIGRALDGAAGGL